MLRLNPHNVWRAMAVSIVAVLLTIPVDASELTAYIGGQEFNSIDGKSTPVPFRYGYGLGIRLERYGANWEGFGYTDRKWAEVSVLKTHYLIGEASKSEIGEDPDQNVIRVKNFQLLASFGGGFFISTTTTVKYDLPVVLNGALILSHLEGQFAVSDEVSLVTLGRIGATIGQDGFGYIGALLGGMLYRF